MVQGVRLKGCNAILYLQNVFNILDDNRVRFSTLFDMEYLPVIAKL